MFEARNQWIPTPHFPHCPRSTPFPGNTDEYTRHKAGAIEGSEESSASDIIESNATLNILKCALNILKCALSRQLIKLFVPQSCQPDRASGRNYKVI